MESFGLNLARASWASSLECHHLCMVMANALDVLGLPFPEFAADLVCQCFLPKGSFAACLEDTAVCLLSNQGDKVYGLDVHSKVRQEGPRRARAMSISTFDGAVAWAPFYSQTGQVLLQRSGVSISEVIVTSDRVDVFALSFVGSKPLLVVGLVNEEDESSVLLYDYASCHEVMSCELPDVGVVGYMSDDPYDDIRIIEGNMSVSSDGLLFGIADGWNLIVWDFREVQILLKRRIQPAGLAFSLDSHIITAATNERPGTRFLSFVVASGEPAYDHAMNMKYLNEMSGMVCPMVYTGLGFLVYLMRTLILVNSSGETVLHAELPFNKSCPVISLASIPEYADGCARLEELLCATVIQPVVHKEEPTAIGPVEAAEIVAQQETSLVDLLLADEYVETAMAKPKTFLCTLNRWTKEVRELLCNGPQLKHAQDKLGHQNWRGPGGSLIFVEEELIEPIMSHVGHKNVQLRPSNLVVSSSYMYLVEEAIDKVRKAWCKSNEEIKFGDDGSSVSDNGFGEGAPISDISSCCRSDHDCSEGFMPVCKNTFFSVTRPAAPDDSVT